MATTTDVPTLSALLLTGELRPVPEVAKQVTGNRPSPPVVHRWIRGSGVRLEAAYHSGRWCTTVAAFQDFIARQTAARLARTQHVLETATDQELAACGLL